MTLPALELTSGPAPTTSVIVLHGLGADGHDFVPVCEMLDLSALGDVRFVLPHAPSRPVTINGGMVMPAWYDILQPGGAEDEAGLRASQAQVLALIDRELGRGIAAQRLVLMGFSQGCAMALLSGLRCAAPLAGIVGLSGYLPLASSTAAEQSAANAARPIFLAHGRFDDVVHPARGEAARDALLALGHAVDWHSYPMGHEVCQEEIDDIRRWLLNVLARK